MLVHVIYSRHCGFRSYRVSKGSMYLLWIELILNVSVVNNQTANVCAISYFYTKKTKGMELEQKFC